MVVTPVDSVTVESVVEVELVELDSTVSVTVDVVSSSPHPAAPSAIREVAARTVRVLLGEITAARLSGSPGGERSNGLKRAMRPIRWVDGDPVSRHHVASRDARSP